MYCINFLREKKSFRDRPTVISVTGGTRNKELILDGLNGMNLLRIEKKKQYWSNKQRHSFWFTETFSAQFSSVRELVQ